MNLLYIIAGLIENQVLSSMSIKYAIGVIIQVTTNFIKKKSARAKQELGVSNVSIKNHLEKLKGVMKVVASNWTFWVRFKIGKGDR